MKELSLNILDIAQNSISAGARHISVILEENDEHLLRLSIIDDGCGMSPETVMRVTNPFYTTRTTRKVGMGIPLLKLAAEQAGGELEIESVTGAHSPGCHGTTVRATFHTDNIDFTPLGDIVSTVCVIIQGHPEIDYIFRHTAPGVHVEVDTAALRAVLGDDVSLAEPEVIQWISEYLREQYSNEK